MWSDPSGLYFWSDLGKNIKKAATAVGSFVNKYKAEIIGAVVGAVGGLAGPVAGTLLGKVRLSAEGREALNGAMPDTGPMSEVVQIWGWTELIHY